MRAYYRRHKDNYRRTASREIEYVTFEVAPSEADFAAAAEHMATVAEEFAAAEDPMQYAQLNSQERADATYYTADRLSGDEYAIAFGDRRDQMAGPTLAGNVYTVSRVADRRTLPDSVGARHILLPAGSTSADSLVRAIRGGADIFALAPLYSIDGMVDLGRFPPEMMVEPFADAVIAARATDVFSVETQFGIHVVQMTYKGATVTKARVATVTYTVEPSAATEQAAYNEAREFLTAAAGSREKFNAAVTSTGVNRRVATIGQNDRNVSGLPNSRGIVSWSFNAKPGTVSTIMEVDGDYVVAVLTDAREAGVADVREVAQTIAQQLRTDEKAVMLAKQMAGKSVAEVAAMEGATTGDITALRPNAFFNPALGMEPAVMGAFEAMKAGDTSKPIESFGGVYVISVSAVEALEEATDASERVRLEAASDGTVAQRLMQALADGSDIKDYRVKFF